MQPLLEPMSPPVLQWLVPFASILLPSPISSFMKSHHHVQPRVGLPLLKSANYMSDHIKIARYGKVCHTYNIYFYLLMKTEFIYGDFSGSMTAPMISKHVAPTRLLNYPTNMDGR